MESDGASMAATFDETTPSTDLALGILPGDNQETGLATAFRALEEDFRVFLPASSLESEVIDRLEQFEISVVDVQPDVPSDELRQSFAVAADTADCNGLVLCEGGADIDFDASRQRVAEAETFSVTAVVNESEATTGRLVGIPAYNESVGIGSTVLTAQQFADEVVVIDDGSADNTVEIVEQTDATLLEHEDNQGKGQALKTFFEYARASDHESFVVLDGDGQHLPDDIPAVVEPIEEGAADLVVGSRYLEDDSAGETPFHRRFGQQVLDYLTFGSSGTKLTDTQSGFRAFSPEAIETLSIETNGMGVESEMIATAQDSALTIEERSIDVRYDGIDGQTFNPVRHGLGVAMFLVQSIRDRHPLLFYGVPGAVLAGAGVVSGLIASGDEDAADSRRLFVSMVLTVVGLVGILCGLVLNRIANTISSPESEE